jgi:hypothetical protein
MRRALVPLAVLALVASSLSAEAAVRRKPTIPACPVFTDAAKDDAHPAFGAAAEDAALDIVGTKMTVAGSALNVTLTMGKMGQPSYSEGAEYSGGFTLGGKAVTLFYTVAPSRPVTENGFALQGITVDGEYVDGTMTQVTAVVDSAKSSITLTTSLSNVSAAAGVKATGTVKGLLSAVRAQYGVLLSDYDDASTTKTLALGGCKA